MERLGLEPKRGWMVGEIDGVDVRGDARPGAAASKQDTRVVVRAGASLGLPTDVVIRRGERDPSIHLARAIPGSTAQCPG